MARFIIILFFLAPALVSGNAWSNTRVFERGEQRVEVIFSGLSEEQEGPIAHWIEATAADLASVFGHWPRNRWQVLIQGLPARSGDPIPWAQVNRGNPDRVTFYVDRTASFSELRANWTAFHEFSHLLIPYRGWGDMWFSEGLASYYQNLLQARAGLFDERELWNRLASGFERGERNHRPDLTLAELSPRMHENRSHMRVYWTGAWYFLKADLELRKRSEGLNSLDQVLSELNECCGERRLSAWQIARTLDRISGESLFVPLFREISGSYEIPDYRETLRELGVEVANEQVLLSGDATASSIRVGIYQGVVKGE